MLHWRDRLWLDSKYVPALCAFAKEQKVAIVTYNEQGVVSESPEDPWALKECFIPVCRGPLLPGRRGPLPEDHPAQDPRPGTGKEPIVLYLCSARYFCGIYD